MRNHSLFIFLPVILIAVLSGCGISSKTASEGTPMIVIDGGARLFDGSDIIGSLPAGTEVTMIERKDNWCLVEVPVDDYNMKIKGSISADALAPAPENASVQVISPSFIKIPVLSRVSAFVNHYFAIRKVWIA